MIVEKGVPFEGQSNGDRTVLWLLGDEVRVGPSRRRRSGRKGQGAGLGLAEDEADEKEVQDDEGRKGGIRAIVTVSIAEGMPVASLLSKTAMKLVDGVKEVA